MVEQALPLAQKAAQLFSERGIENARLEAELLLAHVLAIKRLDLYLQFDRPLTELQLEEFRGFVRRRLKREPLQYITGRAQFRELDLRVDRRALIPRPETEELVGAVIRVAKLRAVPLRVIDIGAGSGAIALSLAHECRNLSVTATDSSAEAITLAQENAVALAVEVEWRVGELWEPIEPGETFDVVVSNPPYVPEAERASLQPEVRDWEPAGALFAGVDGLDVVRALIRGAPPHMNEGALLALEIGMTQARAVKAIIDATASFEDVCIARDLSGRDRIVTAIRKKQS